MIKHAPGVPQCAVAFEALFREAGAPEGAYTNLFISNDQSEQLISRREVRGVALTGSERAGSAVASQAGRSLKKSTMELGGSDAFIVLDDAKLDEVIPNAVAGRMMNNGQVCTSAKRMIVHDSSGGGIYRAAEQRHQRISLWRPAGAGGHPWPHEQRGRHETRNHPSRQGGRAWCNPRDWRQAARQGGVLHGAGILTNVTKDNPVFYEEIFGPVAMIYPVKSDAEAVALANDLHMASAAPCIRAMSSAVDRLRSGSRQAWFSSTA
jgi:succinate-semialdehyde dehydrogenase/glutarate-semialdehyde dehydrogenase